MRWTVGNKNLAWQQMAKKSLEGKLLGKKMRQLVRRIVGNMVTSRGRLSAGHSTIILFVLMTTVKIIIITNGEISSDLYRL